MKEYDSTGSSWITALDERNFSDDNFQKILSFFLIHTPVISLFAQAKDLHSHGWSSPWNKKYYLNKQLKEASSNYNLIFSTKKYDVMSDAITKADLRTNFLTDLQTERIAIYISNKDQSQFISVFNHIRNSIAHARFVIRKAEIEGRYKRVYVFQDGKLEKNGFKISARMVLREETLLKWIDIISGGEVEYNKIETNTA